LPDDERDEQGQHHRRRDLVLEVLHRARRQHLAEEQEREPQPALAEHGEQTRVEVGRVEGFGTAHLLDVLGGLLVDDVHDVVDRDDALHLARSVHDRDGHEVVVLEDLGDGLLLHHVRDHDDGLAHHVADVRLGLGREELPERDDADQGAVGSEDVEVADDLPELARLLAEVQDRLVDRHVDPEPPVAWVHQAAGDVLGVGEERRDLAVRREIEHREQDAPLLLGGFLDEVGRVVGLEQAQPVAPLLGREVEQELDVLGGPEAEEEPLGVRAAQELPARDPLGRGQGGPVVAQLGARQALQDLDVLHRHAGAPPTGFVFIQELLPAREL
jgi:hypothetical protein